MLGRLDCGGRAEEAAKLVIRVRRCPAAVGEDQIEFAIVASVSERSRFQLLQLDIEPERLQRRLQILRDQREGPLADALGGRGKGEHDIGCLAAERFLGERDRLIEIVDCGGFRRGIEEWRVELADDSLP